MPAAAAEISRCITYPAPGAGLPDRANWAYSTALMTKAQPLTRHIVSINDLSNKEIETIFEVAQGFLKELADPTFPTESGVAPTLHQSRSWQACSTSQAPEHDYRSRARCCGLAAPTSPALIRP